MVCVAYGDEPYLIDLLRKNLKDSVKEKALNFSSFVGSFTAEVSAHCYSFPFMEKVRGVILDCDSIKELDTKAFRSYIEKPASSCNLLVILRNADKRSKLFKDLQKRNILRECSRFKSSDELIKALGAELKGMGATMNRDALGEFLKRQDYMNVSTISVLDLVGFLKSMAAVNRTIDIDMVKRFVPVTKEPNCFAITSLIAKKDAAALKKQLDLIDTSDVLKVIGLMQKEVRVSIKHRLFESSLIGERERGSFADVPKEKLMQMLDILNDGALAIKEGRHDPVFALHVTCLGMLQCM